MDIAGRPHRVRLGRDYRYGRRGHPAESERPVCEECDDARRRERGADAERRDRRSGLARRFRPEPATHQRVAAREATSFEANGRFVAGLLNNFWPR